MVVHHYQKQSERCGSDGLERHCATQQQASEAPWEAFAVTCVVSATLKLVEINPQ